MEFHGHLGMWAAVGFVAGSFAMEKLRPEKIKDMECYVELPYRIPYSCLLDGIQVSSSCTIGKRNLRFADMKKEPRIVFENKKTGQRLDLVLKKKIKKEIDKKQGHEKELENTGWILSLKADKIFILRAGRSAVHGC